MNKGIRQIIILIISVIIIGFGASLTMKASLGIGAYDAAAMSISKTLVLKVGSVSMCINIICVLLQLIIVKKEFKPLQFLQIGVAVLSGVVINFFFYSVFSEIVISNYIIRFIMLVLGYIICAFSASIIMSINIVSLPLEGICLILSKKIGVNFGKVRQYADIVSILIVIILTLVFRIDLTLREGTILGMIIFGPMLDRFMNILKPTLTKFELI